MRITPYYESKGIKNPYYVLSPTVVNAVVRELKKQGDDYKNIKSNDILFKSVEPNQLNGSLIYRATSSSSKIFQITDKSKKEIPYGVATTAQKTHVIGHYGMVSRKNATASSNVNEFLSVLPLIVVLIVFYTILWVPQRRRNKRHTKMIDDLKIGNNVVTDSGIYGRIVSLDDNTVTLVLKKGELVVSKNKIDGLT